MPLAALPPRLAHLRMRDFLLLEHLGEVGSLAEAAVRMHVTQSAIGPLSGNGNASKKLPPSLPPVPPPPKPPKPPGPPSKPPVAPVPP